MKIKTGDKVMILKGSYKGKNGDVIWVNKDKILVNGINLKTKHEKSKDKNKAGEIIKKEAPIAVSNVALIDQKTNKPTRVGFSGEKRDKKRISRKTGKEIKNNS